MEVATPDKKVSKAELSLSPTINAQPVENRRRKSARRGARLGQGLIRSL